MSRPYRERLINEVKKCPVLYDTHNENHRDINARDQCWQEISTKLGINSEILKREWKILRDSMRQALKRNKSSMLGGKKWRFQNQMSFLLPYMTKRSQRQYRETIKLSEESQVEAEAETEAEAEPWEAARAQDHDALELFFASVCQAAKRLPRHLQNQVKRQVLDVLLRAEDEHLGEDSKADLSKNYS